MELYYQPGLYGKVGPMFSGKTKEMIGALVLYGLAGMNVRSFRYLNDKRYDPEDMASFKGETKHSAVPVLTTQDVIDFLARDDEACEAEVLAFDEVQFLDYRIIELLKWLSHDRIVLYNGLDRDFLRRPFRFQLYPLDSAQERFSDLTMKELINASDKVEYLTAICTFEMDGLRCGRPAEYTQRLINGDPASYDSPLVLIGSKEEGYEARCRKHHFIPDRPAPDFLEQLKPKF